jgi:membrane-bound lytic murein transglycosylase D
MVKPEAIPAAGFRCRSDRQTIPEGTTMDSRVSRVAAIATRSVAVLLVAVAGGAGAVVVGIERGRSYEGDSRKPAELAEALPVTPAAEPLAMTMMPEPEPSLVEAAIAAAAAEVPVLSELVETAPPEPLEMAQPEVVWDIANIDHERVDYWIRRFTTDKRGEYVRWYARKGHYAPMISEKLAERNMPQDLIFLAMIESGFNPKAYSHAHASGIWQFISETGRRYGLDINRAVDERNDPDRATDAALRYLTTLHNRFGSWYLAAAAYNTGENRVGRIMRQVTGSEKGKDSDFYTIHSRLPRETRDYIPLMIAVARIAKEPQKYGFDDLKLNPPLQVKKVVAKPATPLATIARANGTTVQELRALNPQLKLNRTRNDKPSQIRVPLRESGTDQAR